MATTPLNDNIRIEANKPIDDRYFSTSSQFPYTDASHANAAIHPTRRYVGLPTFVSSSTEPLTEYWYYGGTDDVHLIPKLVGDNSKADKDTGYVSGLTLSINSLNSASFDIAAGYFFVTDYSDQIHPVSTLYYYSGSVGNVPTYLATANATYIAIDSDFNIIQSSSPFDNDDRRNYCLIGATIHSNRTFINVINEIKAPITANTNQLHDLIKAVGPINVSGNVYAASGSSGLKTSRTAGIVFNLGINAADYNDPHRLTTTAENPVSFRYRLQDGTEYASTTDVDPNNYDLNSVLTSVPNNRFTIQRFNLFQSGLTRTQYGQHVYASMDEAKSLMHSEEFNVEQNIAENAIFRAYLIVKEGITNLSASIAADDAAFIPVDKFGTALIGGGGTSFAYTPENEANKVTTLSGSNHTTYPTTQAVLNAFHNAISTGSGQYAGKVGLGGDLLYNTTINTGTSSLYIAGTGSGTNEIVSMESENMSGNATVLRLVNNGSGSAVIGTATHNIGISGISTRAVGVMGTSETSYGVQGQSTSGSGVYGNSLDGDYGGYFTTNGNPSGSVLDALGIRRTLKGAGAPTNGTGVGIRFDLEAGVNNTAYQAGRLTYAWSDAQTGSRSSEFGIWTMLSGSLSQRLKVSANGDITAPGYGSGVKTGTPVYFLAVDNTGKFIETTGSGGGGSSSGSYTFTNGLVESLGIVRLGSSLTQNTTISTAGFDFNLTGISQSLTPYLLQWDNATGKITYGSTASFSSRFGVSGEDATSGQNRTFRTDAYNFSIQNLDNQSNSINFLMRNSSSGDFAELAIDNNIVLNAYDYPNADRESYFALSGNISSSVFFWANELGNKHEFGLYKDRIYMNANNGNSNLLLDLVNLPTASSTPSHMLYYDTGSGRVYRGVSTAARFGVSGEDATATQARNFQLNGQSFQLENLADTGQTFRFRDRDTVAQSTLTLDPNKVQMQAVDYPDQYKDARVSVNATLLGVPNADIWVMNTLTESYQRINVTDTYISMSAASTQSLNLYVVGLPTASASSARVLFYDTSSGRITHGTASAGGSSSTPNLYQVLSQGTNITASSFVIQQGSSTLNFTSSDATSVIIGNNEGSAVTILATTNEAINAYSRDNVGIIVQSRDNVALDMTIDPSSTGSVDSIAYLTRNTRGTASNGIGSSLDFYLENTTGGANLSTKISSIWVTASLAGRTSDLTIQGVNSGSQATIFRLRGTGQLQLAHYTGSAFTNIGDHIITSDTLGNLGRISTGSFVSTASFNAFTASINPAVSSSVALSLTASNNTIYLMDSTAASRTIWFNPTTMYDSTQNRSTEIVVKKITNDSNKIILIPTTGTIDGFPSASLDTHNQSFRIISNNTNLYII